jgi:hypothetical protein
MPDMNRKGDSVKIKIYKRSEILITENEASSKKNASVIHTDKKTGTDNGNPLSGLVVVDHEIAAVASHRQRGAAFGPDQHVQRIPDS